ncbi:hypothetical protein GPEL0_01r4242 [Geoanaerobacter pelophilus]|uniref:Uncharacterized protein n=1 Tax=Geoanaerobacter pelophilus TaxID=60036 RepID=A0ABQ0MLW9_9BACT|nr:hypothetical protein GPEL0_01r4242 [Geoanaerobacter pelophilus]
MAMKTLTSDKTAAVIIIKIFPGAADKDFQKLFPLNFSFA